MKKKLFLSSAILLLTSSVAFAQYENSYSASSGITGWLTFYLIIMILFGILQIILFFKIWGMTDDIRKLRKKFVDAEIEKNTESTSEEVKGTETDTTKNKEPFKIGEVAIVCTG